MTSLDLVGLGASANDGTGSKLRIGGGIINDNFAEISKRIIDGKYILVSAKEDLPDAVSGVITLADNTGYLFTTTIDLTGDRIVCGVNTGLFGVSSESSKIISTGLDTLEYLITSSYSLPIRNLAFEHTQVFFLNGDGATTALDWQAVNIVNSKAGIIQNYSNFIMKDSALLSSTELVFDGTIGTIGISGCLFLVTSGTGITFSDTLTVSRRVKIESSAFVISSGATGINFDFSTTIANEGYRIDYCDFSGAGTMLSDVDYTDNRSAFTRNKGINNSDEIAQYYMNGNATATTISATSTPVKASGTTTNSSVTQKFTHTDNRVTYVGSITRFFHVIITNSVTSGNNHQVGCYVAKNGTVINESEVYGTTSGTGRAENIVVQALVELSTNDYLELFVENATTTTDITVTDLNFIAR